MKPMSFCVVTLALLMTMLCITPAKAQQRDPEIAAAMKKLNFLAGKWEGKSTVSFGTRKAEATGSETAEFRQNGLVLILEGKFFAEVGGRKIPVHDALGVVSYDPIKKQYSMESYRGGLHRSNVLKVVGEGIEWGFRDKKSGRHLRFKMHRTKDDRWVETGEFSSDGKTWTTFMEMNLKHVVSEK